MWVSRNKIISSTQKKVISKRGDYFQIDDADLIAPRCPFLQKNRRSRTSSGTSRSPMTSSFFLWKRSPWCDWYRAISLDFEKYAAKGVIGDLSAVALYTRSHTAAPILLQYRSHIPNPTIPYRSHTAAPISCHTVPIPFQYRPHTVPYLSVYSLRSMARSMAPYCKQYRAIPVWMEYWSSLSNTRAIPQFFVTGMLVKCSYIRLHGERSTKAFFNCFIFFFSRKPTTVMTRDTIRKCLNRISRHPSETTWNLAKRNTDKFANYFGGAIFQEYTEAARDSRTGRFPRPVWRFLSAGSVRFSAGGQGYPYFTKEVPARRAHCAPRWREPTAFHYI